MQEKPSHRAPFAWRLQPALPCESPESHPGRACEARAQVTGITVPGARSQTRPLRPSAGTGRRAGFRPARAGNARHSRRAAQDPGPRAAGGRVQAAEDRPARLPSATLTTAPTPTPRHLLRAGATDPPRAVIDVAADHGAAHVQPQHEARVRARRARLRAPPIRDGGQPRHPDPTSLSAAAAYPAGAILTPAPRRPSAPREATAPGPPPP